MGKYSNFERNYVFLKNPILLIINNIIDAVFCDILCNEIVRISENRKL